MLPAPAAPEQRCACLQSIVESKGHDAEMPAIPGAEVPIISLPPPVAALGGCRGGGRGRGVAAAAVFATVE